MYQARVEVSLFFFFFLLEFSNVFSVELESEWRRH